MADLNPEQLASQDAQGVDIPSIVKGDSQAYQVPNLTSAVPPSQVSSSSGEGPINVRTPDGDLVSIDSAQLQDAISQGYTQASDQEVDKHFKDQKYGTPGQMAITALEGAGQGLAGPLAPLAERALGVDPEDIKGRQQTNPITHGAGELAGFVGGAFTGGTEARAVELAGEAGIKALGIGVGTTALSKIGSSAVKAGIEGLVLGGSDELSKVVINDASPTLGQAAINVGLTGLLGGVGGAAFGSVSPIWKATMGPKLEEYLGTLSKHLNGEPLAMPGAVDAAAKDLGVQVAPVLRSGMSNEAMANQFNVLREMKKPEILGSIEKLEDDVSQKIMEATGKSPDEVRSYSEADTGRTGMETFKKELEERYAPIANAYDEIKVPRMESELPKGVVTKEQTPESVNNPYLPPEYRVTKSAGVTDTLSDRLANMAKESGYATEGTPHSAIVNMVTRDLVGAKTVQDLANIGTRVNNLTKGFSNSHLWDLRSKINSILDDGQQLGLEANLSEKAPQLMSKLQETNQAYKQHKQVLNELAANLSLGNVGGQKGFLEALESKLSPETFLKRLSPRGNAEIIPFLQKNFPKTLESVRGNELTQLIKSSVLRGTEGRPIDIKTLQSALLNKNLSTEVKQFALPKGFEGKVDSASTLRGAVPAFKSSGTAGWTAQLQAKLPASAMGAAAALTGHNPVIGFVLGHVGQLLSRDVPDAIRLATLKFLGSSEPINAPGFKGMVDYLHTAMRGEAAMSKASKNVFSEGKDVISETMMPNSKDRDKLEKVLKSIQKDPSQLINAEPAEAFHYIPEVSQELGQVSGNAVNYLNKIRPVSSKASPLDSSLPVAEEKTAAYNRALDVAVQPLSVLERAKNGTLVPQDVIHLQNVYPKLYSQIVEKVSNEMTSKVAKGEPIAYKLRQGLSILTGQALDSTMTPQAILAAQPMSAAANSRLQPGASGQSKGSSSGSKSSLTKAPQQFQTEDQAAEQRRNRNK